MSYLRYFAPPLLILFIGGNVIHAQNDKQVIGDAVLTPYEIEHGATITYLVRFQNIGEDTSYQVVVRDTLDPRLDPGTFKMLGFSHPHQIVRDGSNIIRWFFDDINLPGSATNPSNSIGFILFSVRPKPFLSPGQTILNHACATFDHIVSVCTNEAIVWIDSDANTDEPPVKQQLQVVPNPNHGAFEVRATIAPQEPDAPAAEWWITDMSGKLIWDGRADNMSAAGSQVLLERPAPGLYLLWVKADGRLNVEEFAVIR